MTATIQQYPAYACPECGQPLFRATKGVTPTWMCRAAIGEVGKDLWGDPWLPPDAAHAGVAYYSHNEVVRFPVLGKEDDFWQSRGTTEEERIAARREGRNDRRRRQAW